MTNYTYGMRNRPAMYGTCPNDRLAELDRPDDPRANYGTASYSRPLTVAELYKWEMIPIDPLPTLPLYQPGSIVLDMQTGKRYEVEQVGPDIFIGDKIMQELRDWLRYDLISKPEVKFSPFTDADNDYWWQYDQPDRAMNTEFHPSIYNLAIGRSIDVQNVEYWSEIRQDWKPIFRIARKSYGYTMYQFDGCSARYEDEPIRLRHTASEPTPTGSLTQDELRIVDMLRRKPMDTVFTWREIDYLTHLIDRLVPAIPTTPAEQHALACSLEMQAIKAWSTYRRMTGQEG